jgi:hypothetical protein
MTIPACCSTPGKACHVGCYDEAHVRGQARVLVGAIFAFLQANQDRRRDGWHERWRHLDRAAYEYQAAVLDPRSALAWPPIAFKGCRPCDPGGWCVNADDDEMADFAYRLRGPITSKAHRAPNGVITVQEEPTFRLPPPKVRVP